ncbi:MAG: chromate transporter [Bacilli bacterium]
MIYLKLFWTFFKIGFFTIGGGYAMIPMIQTEVISIGWLTDVEFTNFLAISESTPGPFAVNMATFVGYNQANVLGGICATLGVVVPSFIIIIIVAKILNKFLHSTLINSALTGVKPVVSGLIIAVAIGLLYKAMFFSTNTTTFHISIASIIVAVVIFTMSRFEKLNNPILLIVISAVMGIVMFGLLQMT